MVRPHQFQILSTASRRVTSPPPQNGCRPRRQSSQPASSLKVEKERGGGGGCGGVDVGAKSGAPALAPSSPAKGCVQQSGISAVQRARSPVGHAGDGISVVEQRRPAHVTPPMFAHATPAPNARGNGCDSGSIQMSANGGSVLRGSTPQWAAAQVPSPLYLGWPLAVVSATGGWPFRQSSPSCGAEAGLSPVWSGLVQSGGPLVHLAGGMPKQQNTQVVNHFGAPSRAGVLSVLRGQADPDDGPVGVVRRSTARNQPTTTTASATPTATGAVGIPVGVRAGSPSPVLGQSVPSVSTMSGGRQQQWFTPRPGNVATGSQSPISTAATAPTVSVATSGGLSAPHANLSNANSLQELTWQPLVVAPADPARSGLTPPGSVALIPPASSPPAPTLVTGLAVVAPLSNGSVAEVRERAHSPGAIPIVAPPAVNQPSANAAPFRHASLGQQAKTVQGMATEEKLRQWLSTIPTSEPDSFEPDRQWDDVQIHKIAQFAQASRINHMRAEEIYRQYVVHQVEIADELSD